MASRRAIKEKTYICPRHPRNGEISGSCQPCVKAFQDRRPADKMTGKARAAALRWWLHPDTLTIPFSDLRQRINELVGRPVFTHELIDLDSLIREARTQQYRTLQESIDVIPKDKNVIFVGFDT